MIPDQRDAGPGKKIAPSWADDMHDELMRLAVAELQKQYGWDERTAASVMLTVTTAVGLSPKSSK